MIFSETSSTGAPRLPVDLVLCPRVFPDAPVTHRMTGSTLLRKPQWAHLPFRGVSLASPVALLELLAKALSVTRDDTHALTLPGGVLAVPARHPALPPGQL